MFEFDPLKEPPKCSFVYQNPKFHFRMHRYNTRTRRHTVFLYSVCDLASHFPKGVLTVDSGKRLRYHNDYQVRFYAMDDATKEHLIEFLRSVYLAAGKTPRADTVVMVDQAQDVPVPLAS